jgi:hypothetical protein
LETTSDELPLDNLPPLNEILSPSTRLFDEYCHSPRDPQITGAIVAPYNLSIATLNVNGLTVTKLDLLLDYMLQQSIDCLLLQDTRTHEEDGKYLRQRAKDFLGPGSFVASFSLPSPTLQIGGQMIIILPTWGGAFIKTYSDRSNLGILNAIYLDAHSCRILLMSTYWPNPYDGRNSLQSELQSYLAKNRIRGSALKWAQDTAARLKDKHLAASPSNVCILAGDFNHFWFKPNAHNHEGGGSRGCLQPWALAEGWANPGPTLAKLRNIPLHTRFYPRNGIMHKSLVDHILTCGTQLTVTGILTSTNEELNALLSDHHILWITAHISGGRGSRGLVNGPPPKPLLLHRNTLDTSDPTAIQEYQAKVTKALQDFDDPSTPTPDNLLLHVAQSSQAIASQPSKRRRKRGHRSPHKDGWSPTSVAHRARLYAYLHIRQHVYGHGKER